MTPFTLDADGLRAELAADDPDNMPWFDESPGRTIESMIYDYSEWIEGPEGWSIDVYPMVFESDPDCVLVVLRHSDYRRAGMAGYSQEWDDLVTGPRASYHGPGPLTVDQVVEVIQGVVNEANKILINNEEAT